MVTKDVTKLSLNIAVVEFYKKCGGSSIHRGDFNAAVLEADQLI